MREVDVEVELEVEGKVALEGEGDSTESEEGERENQLFRLEPFPLVLILPMPDLVESVALNTDKVSDLSLLLVAFDPGCLETRLFCLASTLGSTGTGGKSDAA